MKRKDWALWELLATVQETYHQHKAETETILQTARPDLHAALLRKQFLIFLYVLITLCLGQS